MTGESQEVEPTRRQWVGYWSMIVQQTQNAFNDKMAQFILIPLAGAIGFLIPVWPGVGVGLESVAGLMISLPFVLFAPVAGWLSDRYSKRHVMIGAAVAQTVILTWISLAVWAGNMWMALMGFFGLAVQSAFFGPAKMGINKELVGSKHLGFATGIQQMTAMLAILSGQIVAGKWFDGRWESLGNTRDVAWDAGLLPLLVLLLSALPAVLLAWIIPKVPAQGGEPFTRRVAFNHFKHLSELWSDPGLRQAACGVAFFWDIAAFINLWSIKLAKYLTDGGKGFGSLSSDFMAAASLGMAAGFGVAACLLRKRIELGWVPMGGVGMALMSVSFLFLPFGGHVFMAALAVLAFASALFLAPLNAWLQDNYPANKRGEYQAAVNLLDCLAGILAVVFIEGFMLLGKWIGLDAGMVLRLQMLFGGILCAWATVRIMRKLPADFMRLVCLMVMGPTCRVRAAHLERLPKSGGVLLLPNHVSYLDAFLISKVCPRPVRFVMDATFIGTRWVEWFARIFGTMFIARDKPLEAIRKIIGALKQGEIVCYFPEGQLTRTGCVCPLQRGFEVIAHKAGHPVMPMWIDGAWGSITSYERNRFFSKIPHRGKLDVVVGFGELMEPSTIGRSSLREGLLRASAEAIAERFVDSRWQRRPAKGGGLLAEMFDAGSGERHRQAWINGHQIRMVNALQPGAAIHVWKSDPLLGELHGLLVGFAAFARARVRVVERVKPRHGQVWVGGDALRDALIGTGGAAGIDFFDFSSDAPESLTIDGVDHHPCLAVDGRVIAMSMPDPREVPQGFAKQRGHKSHSYGRLLPGWRLEHDASGAARAHGPAASAEGLRLPRGCEVDDEGFVVKTQG